MSDASLSLADRAPLYAWLAPLFAREIELDLWEILHKPEIRGLLAGLEPEFSAWIEDPLGPERQEECAAEFARLFLLPGGVPPFASAWMDGNREQLGAKLSTIVLRSCEVLGRQPERAEPWGNLALDHLALLLDLTSGAALSSDPLDQQVAEHLDGELLGEWIFNFGSALEEKAELPIYRALGRFLQQLHTDEPA